MLSVILDDLAWFDNQIYITLVKTFWGSFRVKTGQSPRYS